MLNIKKITIALLATISILMASPDGSGTYFGIGGGVSDFAGEYTISKYYDRTGRFVSSDQDVNADDNGLKVYGGYQFNKIFGVEAAYTYYGTMDYYVLGEHISQKPESISVYANIGYSFLDGQLRPFGLIGLGYIKTKHSSNYVDDDGATIHTGVGVEYYPKILKGAGMRLAFEADTLAESYSEYNSYRDLYTSDTLARMYSLLYFGVQYKF